MSESDTPRIYNIDLRAWGRRIWATRISVLVVVAVVTVGYWIAWAVWQDEESTTYHFSRLVEFVFEGHDEGRYPDGSSFRITDVVAPGVLSDVYDNSNLDAQGISLRDFAAGLGIRSVQSSQPGASMARLSFTAMTGDFPDTEQIDAFLLNIPQRWSERVALRVLAPGSRVSFPTARIFDDTLHSMLDYDILMEKLRSDRNLIKDRISRLKNRPGGESAKDEGHTEFTLEDVSQFIKHAEMIYFDKITASVNAYGLTRYPDMPADFQIMRAHIQELEILKAHHQKNAEIQRGAFHLYTGSYSHDTMISAIESTPGTRQSYRQFRDWMSSLVRDQESMNYLRGIVNKMRESEQRTTQILPDRIRARLENLQSGAAESGTAEDRAELIKVVEADIAEFVRLMRNYLDVVYRIRDRIDEEYLDNHGPLYLVAGPMEAVPVSGPPSMKQAVLFYVMLLAVVTAGTLLVALLVRREATEDRHREYGGTSAGG